MRKLYSVLFLSLAVFFVSCGFGENGLEVGQAENAEGSFWNESDLGFLSEEIKEESEADTQTDVQADIEAEAEIDYENREGKAESKRSNGVPCYAYQTLSAEDQQVYREVYEAIISFAQDAEISAIDADHIKQIMECVLADHPEIFYVNGFDCVTHSKGDRITRLTFTASYTLTQEEIADRREKLEDCIRQIRAEIPESQDDFEKILYLYEYLIQNTDYDTNAPENQSLISALVYGTSVCQGYAKAFQYLCQQTGIPAVLVTGTAQNGGHAWVLVQSNGAWYHTDPTWGDSSYRIGRDSTGEQSVSEEQTVSGSSALHSNDHSSETQQISYDYLLVTTAQITCTHTINTPYPLPPCDTLTDNYYIRTNTWFNEYNEERLKTLFQQALTANQPTLTLKCSTEAVYRTFHQTLIEDQQIFQYLPHIETLTYYDSPDQLTLTFWLR